MTIFAKVPFEDVVLRSHEMLPTEYRVLTYLYGRKNRKTGQCNPRKAMIARELHIDRSNVSRALDGLVKRGWIALDDDQNWQFFIPVTMGKPTLPFAPRRGGRNVVKITTKPNVENVVNLTTNEPETPEEKRGILTTQLCDIRTPVLSIYPISENAHYISSSLTEKEQSIEQKEREEADLDEKKPSEISAPKPDKKTDRGSRLPDPFLLTADMRAYAAKKRPEIDAILETEKFSNYWRAKPGKDARKLDWLATWRNWILNARSNGNGTSNGRNGQDNRNDADLIRDGLEYINNKYSD